jgi:hypothetical protein
VLKFFQPNEDKGFEWWTFCTIDHRDEPGYTMRQRGVKLGPVTLLTWADPDCGRHWELHCMNRLLVMVPGWSTA